MFVNFTNVLETSAARSRRSASPRSASRSATRSRRATSCSAPASSSRWRWSTSCRPTRASSGTSTGARSGFDWYVDLGMPGRPAAAAAPRRRRAVALLVGHLRRGVPVPVGLGRARGHRQPRRLRPHPARQALGRAARVLRPGHQRALRAARDRAGRRRHPHDDGVPHGRLRRGGGQRRDPHRAAPAPPPRARTRWRCCRCRRRTTLTPAGPRGARAARSRTSCATTTRRRPSAAATAARTRSARRSASPSTSTRLEDRAVTVRDRDSMEQERVPIDELVDQPQRAHRRASAACGDQRSVPPRGLSPQPSRATASACSCRRPPCRLVYVVRPQAPPRPDGAEGPPRRQGRQPRRDDLGARACRCRRASRSPPTPAGPTWPAAGPTGSTTRSPKHGPKLEKAMGQHARRPATTRCWSACARAPSSRCPG